WEVEVLTTCAADAMTWANQYDPGEVEINGVRVRRFLSEAGRDPGFHPYSGALLAAGPANATTEDADRWIDLQGPVCSQLIGAIRDSPADLIAFYPYLYHPTVRGLPLVADRSVFHPATHDEPPLRLPVFGPVFQAASALVFQTYGERRLAHRLFPVAATPQIVLGLGVDEVDEEVGPAPAPVARGTTVRDRFGLGERPYLISVARYLDDHKGTDLLWSYFREYKARRPGPLALVLVGQVVKEPDPDPDVVSAGMADDETKWALLRESAALVSASAFEAFSLAVVEGWTADSAVIVNGHCEATLEHAQRSGGGLWYEDYPSFEAAVDRLLHEPGLRDELVARGRRYVDDNFRWDRIIGRYGEFLEKVMLRRG
ncbi:MAG TPA: glycosyltransferase family 4 protein, partial [Acidimicrobiales bacterium]|nr:glycosyltransferase family 4 protein [Acidimicrobiales bacterium]